MQPEVYLTKIEPILGHLILWCKKHYDCPFENVVSHITGMPNNGPIPVRTLLFLLSNSMHFMNVDHDWVTDFMLTSATTETKKISTYHLDYNDQITLNSIVDGYVKSIMLSKVPEYLELPDVIKGL